MRDLAVKKRLAGVLAPVRPTRKHEFPHEPIESYGDKRDERGRLRDPWLRLHEELGAKQLGIIYRAVTVRGTVRDWEKWTGREFRQSGLHAVEQALVPVRIDRERDIGLYEEPNVWYYHQLQD
jgi:hypothetical protein